MPTAGADTGILEGGGASYINNQYGESAGGGRATSRAKRGSFWESRTWRHKLLKPETGAKGYKMAANYGFFFWGGGGIRSAWVTLALYFVNSI